MIGSAAPHRALAVLLTQLVNAGDLARQHVLHEEEIDEAGARHFGLGHDGVGGQRGHDGLRQLPGVTAGRFGQAHGNVGCKVTMLGVARTLDRDSRGVRRLREQGADELLQGGENELFELLLQGLGTSRGRRASLQPSYAPYALPAPPGLRATGFREGEYSLKALLKQNFW